MTKGQAAASDHVRELVSKFIQSNFLFGDASRMPALGDSFMSAGVIDSTGILELIEFIESEFHIVVEEEETTPQNLDSIENVVAYVQRKLDGGE